MNPTKPIHNEKLFKYDLLLCPKKPNKKAEERKKHKEDNNLTTNQGMPIFSTFDVYKHYLTVEQWQRATQLPSVLSFFEMCLNANYLIAKIALYVHPEFAVWATSCPGMRCTRKSYETLETYGDTILKLAATMLAYKTLETDKKADEKNICNMKDTFITNLNLYRLGQKLKLREHMRMKDPDPKAWQIPFSITAISPEEFLTCTGKNLADGVESLLGAVFLSNNLHKTLRFISDIELVPLVQADLMKYFPDDDLTFHLRDDLDVFNFDLNDNVQSIFEKYYSVEEVSEQEKHRLTQLIDPYQKVNKLGSAFDSKFEQTG